MTVQNLSTPVSVDKIVERILAFRQITRTDQNLLMSALLAKNFINDKDQYQINRVFEGVQKGSIRVVE
ncbi:MAG: hypothetical protein Fur0025_15970 [Oscillatoriaceae cyanobacterium]